MAKKSSQIIEAATDNKTENTPVDAVKSAARRAVNRRKTSDKRIKKTFEKIKEEVKRAKAPAQKTTKKKSKPKAEKKVESEPNGRTSAEATKIAERRRIVWDLHVAKVSIRRIAEHLESKGIKEASIGTIHSDIQHCLSLQHKELGFSVEEHIESEVAVLDDIHFTFYPIMKDSRMPLDARLDCAALIRQCSKDRVELRNLKKPKQVNLNLNVDEELARLVGLEPEELPDSDSNGET